MEIYAHRAGRGLAPENTLIACETVLQHGVDVIDFDIGMTKEGELVVTHDVTLNPAITRDAQGKFVTDSIPVYALTYAELATYNVAQINPTVEYASYFPHQKRVEKAVIPLLKEAIDYVLSLAPEIGFQIEIKTDPALTAPPEVFAHSLYKLLKESKLIERTEVQSFDYRTLFSLQKLDPEIKTAYLTVKSEIDFSPKQIKDFGGSCWGPFQMDITYAEITEAKALGLKVVPWGYPEKEGTEFNQEQIAKLIAWGVDGIITDRPDILKKILYLDVLKV